MGLAARAPAGRKLTRPGAQLRTWNQRRSSAHLALVYLPKSCSSAGDGRATLSRETRFTSYHSKRHLYVSRNAIFQFSLARRTYLRGEFHQTRTNPLLSRTHPGRAPARECVVETVGECHTNQLRDAPAVRRANLGHTHRMVQVHDRLRCARQ